jgi:ubiquinone/menaquinone biosynthesis C-methylase UbiE
MKAQQDFTNVTEIAGQGVSHEQLQRTCHRYYWALLHVEGKDVLEVACGSGPGLALLAQKARSVKAGDISKEVLAEARKTYGERFDLRLFAAEKLPYPDQSLDVVLLFEAIYYVNAQAFLAECHRVLRASGKILIASANCGLYDFTRSAFSTQYFSSQELQGLGKVQGFSSEVLGYLNVKQTSVRQKILRPVKFIASRTGLMPKSMKGKEGLKKLFFGSMTTMPADVSNYPFNFVPPEVLPTTRIDRHHKVLYCLLTKNHETA